MERTITEHFADFPKASIELERREGQCLRDRLLSEKRAKRQRRPLVTAFHPEDESDIRTSRLASHTVGSQRSWADCLGPFASCHGSDGGPKSSEALQRWPDEAVALCRWCAQQNAARQPSSRTVMMKVLDFFCRGALHTTFAEEMSLMRPVWDHLLATQYTADKKERMSAPTWWMNFGYLCRVLSCHAELDAIFLNYGQWLTHADRLAKVCKSHLGERLFGDKNREVTVLKASDDMVRLVRAFSATPSSDDVTNLQALWAEIGGGVTKGTCSPK